MGKFGFQPRLGHGATSGVLSKACIENKGFILAPRARHYKKPQEAHRLVRAVSYCFRTYFGKIMRPWLPLRLQNDISRLRDVARTEWGAIHVNIDNEIVAIQICDGSPKYQKRAIQEAGARMLRTGLR
jgi:hypothetical protein